jgi:GT2 family glycosyltransferase
MKRIAIVIVNWNGKDDTLACLTSIQAMKKTGVELTTIVVDNGSTNDSVAVIKKAHPSVTVISLSENLGFTGGNNVGIKEALKNGAEYVWLLNNDTIVDVNALSLVDAFDDPSVGVAGSKIYFMAGREYHKEKYSKTEKGRVFWYAGGIIDWANMYASHKGVDEVDRGQYDQVTDTEFVTGCSFMVSRKALEAVGALDERYYLYLEDLDLCLRIKRARFRLVYYPPSMIWHVNAGSSGGAGNPLHEYYMTRNRLLVGMRYAPLRTKVALIREAIRFLFATNNIKKKAVYDAAYGRWGKQYEQKTTTP